jgi:hypothetical protein
MTTTVMFPFTTIHPSEIMLLVLNTIKKTPIQEYLLIFLALAAKSYIFNEIVYSIDIHIFLMNLFALKSNKPVSLFNYLFINYLLNSLI